MINFFRKIRKKLADDNKPLKYFRYAVGEIALVVIGILIALSINNWNTNKQETKELHSYLKNVKENLQADLGSIEEIKIFRDSSVLYSKNYLEVAKKEKVTIEDFNSIMNSDYNVFHDTYFKPNKSGFEALKNSGFIGRLNGTIIEERLNAYYYLVDKVDEQEASLNNTIESMENAAFIANVKQQMFDIFQMKNKETYFTTNQENVKGLLNQPSMTGANNRNSEVTTLPRYYRQLEQLGKSVISEIDIMIKD